MAGKDIEILLKARDDASAKIKALEDHLRRLNAHNKKFAQDAAPALALSARCSPRWARSRARPVAYLP
jgi:hypothetical protein